MANASISREKKEGTGGLRGGGEALIQRCETDGNFKASLINLCWQYPHFLKRLLIWGYLHICIHTVGSIECQINYQTHQSKYLFYNSLLKMKSSRLRLGGVLIYSDI